MSNILDSALEEIGGFGLFQCLLTVFMFTCAFLGNDASWIDFTDYSQAHWCYVHELRNVSSDLYRYVALPFQEGSNDSTFSQCKMFDYDYSKYSMEEFLHWNRSDSAKTRSCDDGWMYNGSLFKRTVTSDYDLVCDATWKLDLITTLFIAGGLPGSLIAGYFADRYGRKKIIMSFTVLKCLSNVMSILVSNYHAYIMSRFLDGMFFVAIELITFTLISEWVLPKYRPLINFANCLGFCVGFMASPLVSYYIRNYEYFLLFWTVMNTAFLLPIIFIPESPRWLLFEKNITECEKVLKCVAKINKKDFTKFLQSDEPAEFESIEEKQEKKESFFTLWKNKIMRFRLLTLILVTFSSGFTYYIALLGVSKLNNSIFFNSFLMASADLVGGTLATLIVGHHWFGRKNSLISFITLVTIFDLMKVLIDMFTAIDLINLLSTFFCRLFVSSIYFVMILFTVELFPTSVRALSMNILTAAGTLGSMVAPFAGNSLMAFWHPLPTVVIAILCSITVIPICFLPDTRNCVLPESIDKFQSVTDNDSCEDDRLPGSFPSTYQLIE